MKNFNKTFSFGSKADKTELIVNISRSIDNVIFKKFNFIPLSNDAYFYFGAMIQKDPLILPKLYAALNLLSGPSTDKYDDYKGSYSFTFELNVQKNNNLSHYFLNIFHYKSYVQFSIYQIVPKANQEETSVMHQPNAELFSDLDISFFCRYFCNYALGYLEGSEYTPKSFIKCSNSNLLLFGYYQDQYFFTEYENNDLYDKDKEMYSKSIDARLSLGDHELYVKAKENANSEKCIAQKTEEKAIEKGKLEGELQKAQAIARNMLAKKMSHADIAELTGLSVDEIENLG